MQPQMKNSILIDPQSVTAAATATGRIDCAGYGFLSLDVVLGSINSSTSNQPTVLKLGEADVTNTSSMTDIVAFTGGTAVSTSVGFVIPVGVTAASNVVKFNIDLRSRKRYLLLSVSPATTCVLCGSGNLFKAGVSPEDTTLANVAALVEG